MRHPVVRWFGPMPVGACEQCPHRVDVAVVGRAFDAAFLHRGRTRHLHEQAPQRGSGHEPLVQPLRIDDPVVGMDGAQAGLFVDGVEWPLRFEMQHVGLQHLARQLPRLQQFARPLHGRGRVVHAGHVESAPGQFRHLPAAAATRHQDAARRQCAAVQPGQQLRTGAAPVPWGLPLVEPLLPERGGRARHGTRLVTIDMMPPMAPRTRCARAGITPACGPSWPPPALSC